MGLLVSFRDPDPYERPAAVISQQVGFLCIHVYLPVIADIEGMWIHHFADDCSFTLHGSICSDSWIFRLRPHKTLEYPSKSLWGSHCTEIMPLAQVFFTFYPGSIGERKNIFDSDIVIIF